MSCFSIIAKWLRSPTRHAKFESGQWAARRREIIGLEVTALEDRTLLSNVGSPHYPDLQTLPPSDLQIVREAGTKVLRFANTVWNKGQGPLELRPVQNSTTGLTDAYQRVYTHDADGIRSLPSETLVGSFVFHVDHNHWHFENFALYELRSVAVDGGIGDVVHATSGKVTFCVIDVTAVNTTLEHAAATRVYSGCTQNGPQGISVGWGDRYGRRVSGQSLDITSLNDGMYWVVSTADPNNLLNEGGGALEANNRGAVKISITGNKLQVLSTATGLARAKSSAPGGHVRWPIVSVVAPEDRSAANAVASGSLLADQQTSMLSGQPADLTRVPQPVNVVSSTTARTTIIDQALVGFQRGALDETFLDGVVRERIS